MSEFVKVETHDDVVVFRIDNPPVNALSQRMVVPLQQLIQDAQKNSKISGIVLTGTGKFFISGADIKEFSKPSKGPPIPEWFNQIENSNKPIVIAINGFALGGGLELAMAGHYRLALPTCRFGLVELRIGLLPGAGGTQRLPRLVGVSRATEIMMNSEEIKTDEAHKLGLVDEVCQTHEDMIHSACKAVRKLAGMELRRSSLLSDKFGALWREEQKVAKIMEDLEKSGKSRNQIQFGLTADAILTGLTRGSKAGMKKEWNNFLKCLMGPGSRGLMNMFSAQRTSAKVPGITDRQDLTVSKIKLVAVLGGGTMGSGIATWLLGSGVQVLIKEINHDACTAARNRVSDNLKQAVSRGKLTSKQFELMMQKLTCVDSYNGFDRVDFVIEAIFEDINLKKNTFYDLEQVCRKDAILASNTSTISLNDITARMKFKSRVIGVHYFAPAHVMPLVEIIRNEDTSDQTIFDCVNFIKNGKKIVVVVKNCVGFLVNRVFMPISSAGSFLVGCGIDPYRIDDAMVKFGMAMGPFRTADLSGIDITNNAGKIFTGAYGHRLIPATLMDKLVKVGRLGEKTKKGYYSYQGRKAEKDPSIKSMVLEAQQDFCKLYKNTPKKLEITDQEIADLIVFCIINESCRTLEEGIAIRATDIDVASVFGMGLPAYRGGVMHYGKEVGYRVVMETLESYYQKYDIVFFKPCEYLKSLATKSKL
jgi:enoyl-CoA hydratase/3-hydroxyacyl-CoA dehydrogenase